MTHPLPSSFPSSSPTPHDAMMTTAQTARLHVHVPHLPALTQPPIPFRSHTNANANADNAFAFVFVCEWSCHSQTAGLTLSFSQLVPTPEGAEVDKTDYATGQTTTNFGLRGLHPGPLAPLGGAPSQSRSRSCPSPPAPIPTFT